MNRMYRTKMRHGEGYKPITHEDLIAQAKGMGAPAVCVRWGDTALKRWIAAHQ